MPKKAKDSAQAAPRTDSGAEPKKGSWWQTLAGTLTATAAIITAVTGLLVALQQIGVFGGDTNAPSAQSAPITASQTSRSTSAPAAPAANNTQYTIAFPLGTTVKFRNYRGEGTYEVLAANAGRRSVGKLGLAFTIRMTNNGPSDVGFYTDTFRLLADGVPLAPVNQLIDSVDARSAKESAIEFEIPETVSSLSLQVVVGDTQEDTAEMALTLE